MKRRTWLGLAAIPVVAVMTGAAALAAWAHGGPGGPGMHGRMMKRMVSAALDEALDQAKVTPEQRAAIHAARDRAFAAADAHQPDRRAHREEVLALFEADRIDPARVEALHATMKQRHETLHAAVTQAVMEIHATLTPEQRRVVAQFVREHTERRWH
jgi:Spy/CpxP family protein refolding chaperone